MTTEKRKKLRVMNLLAFLVLAGVTLTAYFMPLNGINVLTLEMNHPNLISGPAFIWYLYFLSLLGMALFTWFQAGNMQFRNNISAKTLDTLGWIPTGVTLFYSLAIVFLHYERFGFAMTLLIFTAILLMAANGNIRDQEDVMDEKFWVRNPFSFFFGWVLYLLMNTIAMRWQDSFSRETPALILFIVFLAFILYFAFANMNLGLPISWMLGLLIKQLQNPDRFLLRAAFWAGIAVLLLTVILIARKDRHQHYYRKPVVRAMDKYNEGQASQIEELEHELNAALGTKPGARINLRK